MKKCILLLVFFSAPAFASNDIDVSVDSIRNVAKSSVLEVCGKAISKTGKWPIVVSITHGQSTFSTITGIGGNYCQLLGRQTNKGEVSVSAASMDGQSVGSEVFELK